MQDPNKFKPDLTSDDPTIERLLGLGNEAQDAGDKEPPLAAAPADDFDDDLEDLWNNVPV